ncbi:hypothetical protein Q8F55_003998 [Vanrija albida]|uniref:Exonuclease domain-containing protein n=1 Tax=Vanrija albida TaxID=181172 RepID=A0ABR3Q6K1_9TREE
MTIVALDRYVAIDCEMVRCNTEAGLARVALVDHAGKVLYHSFVFQHPANVVDYQTQKSGITQALLKDAPTVETVRKQVVEIIGSKIIVGHALFNDLAVLQHRHDYEDVRDTALFYPIRERMGIKHEGMYPSLRLMAKEILGRDIQDGAHCPIEDARTTMEIFLKYRAEYEKGIADGDDVVSGVPRAHAKWYW